MKLPALALAVAALLAAQTDAAAQGYPPPEPARPILGGEGARFVFGQVSAMRADQYLLDTQTGRLWQITKARDGLIVLQPVPVELIGGKRGFAPDPAEEAELFRQWIIKQPDRPEPQYTAEDYKAAIERFEKEGNKEGVKAAKEALAEFEKRQKAKPSK